MIETFQKLNRHPVMQQEITGLHKNPYYMSGSSVSCYYRFIFLTAVQEDNIYIDYLPQKAQRNCFYIVPAGHALHLPPTIREFYILTLDHTQLSDAEKSWLYSLKYAADKSVPHQADGIAIASYTHEPNILLPILRGENASCFAAPAQYMQYAEQLCCLLLKIHLHHGLTVSDLAKALNISTRTLNRVCHTIYRCKPQYMIRHHLLSKSIICILSRPADTISLIADALEFKDSGTFTRYIKTCTGLTPTEIRSKYYPVYS